jgi:hypothetical protein
MDYKILADKIIYFEGAMPDSIRFIEEINKADTPFITDWLPWEKYTSDGITGYMKDYGLVKIIYGGHLLTKKIKSFPNDSFDSVLNLRNSIKEACSIYQNKYNVQIENYNNRDMYVISQYSGDNEVDLQEHIDIDGDWEEYSILVYFNDDYIGGEIEFTKLGIKIKPSAGSILIFPSGDPYSHTAHKSYYKKKYFMSHFWKAGSGAGFRPLETMPNEVIVRD